MPSPERPLNPATDKTDNTDSSFKLYMHSCTCTFACTVASDLRRGSTTLFLSSYLTPFWTLKLPAPTCLTSNLSDTIAKGEDGLPAIAFLDRLPAPTICHSPTWGYPLIHWGPGSSTFPDLF